MVLTEAPFRRRTRVMADVTQDAWDEALAEVSALRSEAREVATLIPFALKVHDYVQMVGDSVEAERYAAYVAASLERIAQRHDR